MSKAISEMHEKNLLLLIVGKKRFWTAILYETNDFQSKMSNVYPFQNYNLIKFWKHAIIFLDKEWKVFYTYVFF